ncbi:hypothetical protein FOZ61_006461 [Perkinsus olseni]|uniref:Uncharacterized protein n=1 Tax=Perkinsus olseni TaxID=32597 RepID=A0A7J6MRF8_PEROL|nr:hypothetical protein FOZ61_006461 [Perkinsus olseni]KAF4673830.1 hypothetical protein FOL46_006383 [Perkinsus olseni]
MVALVHTLLLVPSAVALQSTRVEQPEVGMPEANTIDSLQAQVSGLSYNVDQLNKMVARLSIQVPELIAHTGKSFRRLRRGVRSVWDRMQTASQACPKRMMAHIPLVGLGADHTTKKLSCIVDLDAVVRTADGETMDISFEDYKTRLQGELIGPTEKIEAAFFGVNPFPNLLSKIRPNLDSEVTDAVCRHLIHGAMELNSEDWPAGRGWIKEFLDDKMNEAFVIIERHGGTVEDL